MLAQRAAHRGQAPAAHDLVDARRSRRGSRRSSGVHTSAASVPSSPLPRPIRLPLEKNVPDDSTRGNMHRTALANSRTPDRVCLSPCEPRASSRLILARPMSAPACRSGSEASARYYVGRRPAQTEVHVLGRSELEPLAHVGYGNDAAFDRGGSTEGALELAFSMLTHATQSQPTDLIDRAFRAEVVTRLNPGGFVLSYGEIALWLLTGFGDPSSGEPGPQHPDRPGCSPGQLDPGVGEAPMNAIYPEAPRCRCLRVCRARAGAGSWRPSKRSCPSPPPQRGGERGPGATARRRRAARRRPLSPLPSARSTRARPRVI